MHLTDVGNPDSQTDNASRILFLKNKLRSSETAKDALIKTAAAEKTKASETSISETDETSKKRNHTQAFGELSEWGKIVENVCSFLRPLELSDNTVGTAVSLGRVMFPIFKAGVQIVRVWRYSELPADHEDLQEFRCLVAVTQTEKTPRPQKGEQCIIARRVQRMCWSRVETSCFILIQGNHEL